MKLCHSFLSVPRFLISKYTTFITEKLKLILLSWNCLLMLTVLHIAQKLRRRQFRFQPVMLPGTGSNPHTWRDTLTQVQEPQKEGGAGKPVLIRDPQASMGPSGRFSRSQHCPTDSFQGSCEHPLMTWRRIPRHWVGQSLEKMRWVPRGGQLWGSGNHDTVRNGYFYFFIFFIFYFLSAKSF